MPSVKHIPVPPTALTLSFGGVDFRLDTGSPSNVDSQVSFRKNDNDVLLQLTGFTGTLRVSMTSLASSQAQETPSRVSLEPTTTAGKQAKVVEETASPSIENKDLGTTNSRGVTKISPRQQQLSFVKTKGAVDRSRVATKIDDSEDKASKAVTETPVVGTVTGVPGKPQKGERPQQKRSLVDIQVNPVPSPLTKKSRAEQLDQDSSDELNSLLMMQTNASQLSQTQPSPESSKREFTQGEDTVDGDDEFFLPTEKCEEELLSNKSISTSVASALESNHDHRNILGGSEDSSNLTDSVPHSVTVQPVRRGQPPPSARWGHTMTKLEGDRILVYGGQGFDSESGAPQILSDIHVYDMNKHVWYQPVNCEGVPRQWHTATYLPERQLLISFGGETKHPKTGRITTTDQVMVLDTEIMLWYPPTVSGVVPSGRSGHSATILPQTNELVVFGGVKGSKWQNSVAVLDISRWRWSAPKVHGDAPRPRSYHSATAICSDDGDSRLVIFGGNDAVSSFSTVHILKTEGSSWTWIHPSVGGSIPSPRTGHCATLLGDNKTIMIYGGWDPNADETDSANDDEDMIYPDSYLLNTDTWQWRVGPKPAFAGDGESTEHSLVRNGGARRVGHTSVRTDNTETLVFGGRVPGDKFACDFQTLALE